MQTAEINSIEATLRELAPLVTDVQRTLETGLEEGGSGTEAVAAVVQPLATIRGTLELIELHGAAILVREMGELAGAVAASRTAEAERALETLLEAVLRLPDYLDRVRSGHRDTPSVLLPLINELRSLRGDESLAESALFFPPLPAFRPAGDRAGGEGLQLTAQRLRGRFQRSLLGWYRGSDEGDPLGEIGAVLQELADQSADPGTQQLWEVGGALVDSLRDAGGDAEGTVKTLLARVERLVSGLARDGDIALDRESPVELLRSLLFHIAHLPSDRPSVQAVRRAYQLDPFAADATAGASFEGPNRELLGAVGEGIRADLAQVKDAVEIYVHSDERRPGILDGLPERLKQIADTFSMLGLTEDRRTLTAEAAVLRGIDELDAQEADERLQALADELLRVEVHLAQLQSGRAHPVQHASAEQGPLGVRALPDSEYWPLVSAVVVAGLEDLSKVREAVGVYCSDPEADSETLSEVPALLVEVEGAAAMLPLDRAVPVVRDLRDYVARELVAGGRRPDADGQVLIADVVAGLEYYLEAVSHDRAGMTHLLEGAVRAMDALHSGGSRQIYDEDEEVVLEAPAADPDPASADGDRAAAGAFEESAADDGAVIDGDGMGDLEGLDFSAFGSDASAAGESEPDLWEPLPDAGEPAQDGALVFEDMADLALDDAADAPNAGANETPAAAADASLEDALEDTPASAESDAPGMLLDDAPWPQDDDAYELPALDTPAEPSPDVGTDAVIGPVDENGDTAKNEVPDLDALTDSSLDDVAPGPGGDDGVAALAPLPPETPETPDPFELAAPDDDDDAPSAEAPPATAGVDPAASGSRFTIVGDEVDEDVVEVYIEEALGELDKINECLPRWKANTADQDAVVVIRRAYHTLKGGGRLIGAELLGEFSWAMEALLNRVMDRSLAPSAAIFETLEEASAALPQLVEQIQGNRAPIDGIDDLIARAHALSRGEAPPAAAARGSAAQERAAATEAEAPAADEPADADAGYSGPDRTLLEIFAREAETHQAVLRQAFGAAGELPVHKDVDRAIHTLVGSAQTAGVESIADLAGEMEDIVRMRAAHGQSLRDDEVELFREAVNTIDEVLADLPAIGRVDVQDVRARLQAHRERVVEAVQAGGADSDSELLDVFLDEGDELLEQCDRAVTAWGDNPDARAPLADLQRGLHTLKGGARMANLPPIADLTHEFESVINALEAAGKAPDEPAFELMQETVDALTILLEQARAQQPIARVDWLAADLRVLLDEAESASPVSPAPQGMAAESSAPEGTEEAADAPGAGEPQPAAPQVESPPEGAAAHARADTGAGEPAGDAAPMAAAGSEPNPSDPYEAPGAQETPEEPAGVSRAAATSQPASDQVRVQAEVLDNLVNFAGEVSIYHSRLNQQMGQYRFNLAEFQQTVSRLRGQLRTMEDETESQILYRNQSRPDSEGGAIDPQSDFDPLEFDRYTRLQELSRSLSESIGDLDSLKEIMDTVTRDAETLLLQQSRVSAELQDGLMQTRMVRFDGLRGRLARIVRQTAGQLGKKAQLAFTGGELELDRSVQERIVAPLEHALRNAVAHGIESPEERQRLGKPAQGAIQLDLHRGGTDVIIEITDDGRGIDPEAIRRRAIERGLIAADDARDDGEVIKLILETHFSTADEVTQISGRGVGMDVVDAEIRRLGGTLGINTELGVGTRFTIRLPVTLAINQAVLVETGDDIYAIPIASVEGVSQATAGDLKPLYVDPSQPYTHAGNDYRLEHLGRLLGTSEPRLDASDLSYPVIMIRAGDDRIALHVEQLVGRRDIVVKPLGSPLNELSGLSGLSGATIMPDGRVVLILDVGGLVRTESRFVATGSAQSTDDQAPAGARTAAAASTAQTVLVVDDSITIRKVTQRILERHEFNVVTAKDGIDALSWMAQSVPDLILLDIEMPRMDGYEVATYIRGEQRLTGVPIIMITSRTGDKHRQRADAIGVDRYLGKPYQETELMEHIEQLLHSPETA